MCVVVCSCVGTLLRSVVYVVWHEKNCDPFVSFSVLGTIFD